MNTDIMSKELNNIFTDRLDNHIIRDISIFSNSIIFLISDNQSKEVLTFLDLFCKYADQEVSWGKIIWNQKEYILKLFESLLEDYESIVKTNSENTISLYLNVLNNLYEKQKNLN